jgi:serine protease Do
MRVGDWVLAVGNPFGLGGTVTAGIVSASGRDINSGPYDDFLQTDASINRGNSGGPLFNVSGEVVGVNTAIYSPSGGSVGIGFAIPASIAKPVVEQLRENGRVERGWLGVQIQEITPELAASLGLKEAKGALVSAVTPNGPAAKAGLKAGDVIVGVDSTEIEHLRDLPRRIAAEKAGEHAKLSLWRDGKSRTVDVVIGAMPTAQVASADGAGAAEPSRAGALGLALAPLTPDTRSQLGLGKEVEGVAVTAVKPGSPAAEQGLRAGDVVVRVGDRVVTAPRQVAEQVDRARRDGRPSVLMLIARGGGQQFVAVPLGRA